MTIRPDPADAVNLFDGPSSPDDIARALEVFDDALAGAETMARRARTARELFDLGHMDRAAFWAEHVEDTARHMYHAAMQLRTVATAVALRTPHIPSDERGCDAPDAQRAPRDPLVFHREYVGEFPPDVAPPQRPFVVRVQHAGNGTMTEHDTASEALSFLAAWLEVVAARPDTTDDDERSIRRAAAAIKTIQHSHSDAVPSAPPRPMVHTIGPVRFSLEVREHLLPYIVAVQGVGSHDAIVCERFATLGAARWRTARILRAAIDARTGLSEIDRAILHTAQSATAHIDADDYDPMRAAPDAPAPGYVLQLQHFGVALFRDGEPNPLLVGVR